MDRQDETEPTPGPVPGLLLAAGVMLASSWLADRVGGALLAARGLGPGAKNPVSGITVAIVLGLLVANTVGVGERFRPGLKLAMKKVLKLGIILVGIKLSFLSVLELGALGVPLVLTIIVFALVVADLLARSLGLSDALGTLAAASTAICGVTATVAVAGVIDADDDEVAYTVANVTLFGMTAMLVYPYLAHWVFDGSSAAVGLFLGTAIHDTAQVMGAALSYREVFGDETALQVATVTKLTRNVFLVGVVPFLAVRHARRRERSEGGDAASAASGGALRHFPVFVLGFLFLVLVRTFGDLRIDAGGRALGVLDPSQWRAATGFLGGTAAKAALGVAMAGVGLSTRLDSLRRLGWRPMAVGAGAALAVGALAAVLASLAGPHVG